MRDLSEVIDQIVLVTANTEYSKFQSGFESLKNSIMYSPPENIGFWWKKVQNYLMYVVDFKKKYQDFNEIEQKIVQIWTDKNHDQLVILQQQEDLK